MNARSPIALVALLLLACAQTPAGPTPVARLGPDPTDVDRLVLRGEVKGIAPGKEVVRVLVRYPGLTGRDMGVDQAGLLQIPGGPALITDRSGARVQAIWIEFSGTDLVPAAGLRSADGRLRAGATEATVRRWLRDHGLPLLLREFQPTAPPGEPPRALVREYYVDSARSWLVVVNGRLVRALTDAGQLFEEGRRQAKAVEEEALVPER